MLSAAAAHGATVDCINAPSDANIVQSVINGGGTVTINGTCDFANGGVAINNAVIIQGGGTTPTINGNGTNSGFAFTVNADHVTITGLTFNKAIGAAELTGITRSYFTFTNDTVENTNGLSALMVDNVCRYVLIDSNHFYMIAPNGFSSATYASLGFPACWNQASTCDVGNAAIAIGGGLDNTQVTNNTADYVSNDFIHADWHVIGAPAYYFLTSNNSVSYNTLTHIHRIAVELQGTERWPYCGPGYTVQCNLSVDWTSNLKVAGNYYHAPFLPYTTYAYSLVFQGSGVEINNAAIAETDVSSEAAQGLEDLGYGILAQGNVISGEPFTIGGTVYGAWEGGIIYGYNGAIAGSLYTTQNNVLCSIETPNFGTENSGGGRYMAIALNQYNFSNMTCPNAGHLTTSAIEQAFTGASVSGTNYTSTLSAVSTLPIKWVQFFVDKSTTPVSTQEIQDVNTNFANDQKWLYHATLSTAALSSGTHTLTATATDVSGVTSSISESFNSSGPVSPAPAPIAQLTPNSDSFGSQKIAMASAPMTMTLTNTGNAALSISSITISGTNSADFKQSSTCGSSLAAGASCVISTVFTPSGAMSETANLVITDNASGSSQVGTLSGTGVNSGTPTPAPTVVKLTVSDSAGMFWDAGGSQWGQTKLQIYPSYIPNTNQDWTWTSVTGGFTVCSGTVCLSDNGTQVMMGAKADVITITNSSAVLDVTTGHYFANPSSPSAGAFLSTGSTASAWNFSSSLH